MTGPLRALLCVLLATGCGEVEEDPDAAPSGSIDAASLDAITGGGPDARIDGDPDAAPTGCSSSDDCPLSRYCNFPAHTCGPAGTGTCAPRDECNASGNPVCGCDAEVYSDECTAFDLGIDITDDGSCATPDAFFPCGPTYCLIDFSYCEVTGDKYRCEPLPDGCVECSCMADEPCGANCTGEPPMLTLTCG